jgi:hypothetical protein
VEYADCNAEYPGRVHSIRLHRETHSTREETRDLGERDKHRRGFATAFSLLWAAYTYYASENLQRELSAYSAYQDHMKTSMDHPEWAVGEFAPKPPAQDSAVEDKKKYEQYQWYVGHALYSFESILQALPNDEDWKKTFRGFIDDHKEYIGSEHFPCDRYSDDLLLLVKERTGRDCRK